MRRRKSFRLDRTLIEEFEVNGKPEVRVNGEVYAGNFHEATVAAKKAPLIAMRNECLRLAGVARAVVEDSAPGELDDHDVREMEHEDY